MGEERREEREKREQTVFPSRISWPVAVVSLIHHPWYDSRLNEVFDFHCQVRVRLRAVHNFINTAVIYPASDRLRDQRYPNGTNLLRTSDSLWGIKHLVWGNEGSKPRARCITKDECNRASTRGFLEPPYKHNYRYLHIYKKKVENTPTQWYSTLVVKWCPLSSQQWLLNFTIPTKFNLPLQTCPLFGLCSFFALICPYNSPPHIKWCQLMHPIWDLQFHFGNRFWDNYQ